MNGETEVLAVVRASTPRRWLAVSMMAMLAAMLLWVAGTQPPAFGWQVFLIVLGLASGWMAYRLMRATEGWLELTHDGIRDNSGRVLATLDQVRRVERGMFAFKPSNGFVIHLHEPHPRAWEPGLWWRLGRRVAIGGVTPGSQTKMMSEILDALRLERDRG